jgi:hypothetical protein
VPHVRPTCPGLPWGVRGPKTTGEAHDSFPLIAADSRFLELPEAQHRVQAREAAARLAAVWPSLAWPPVDALFRARLRRQKPGCWFP